MTYDSKEYKQALDDARKAAAAFKLIQEAYRARLIDDAKFLAGKRAYDASTIAFDAAREENTP